MPAVPRLRELQLGFAAALEGRSDVAAAWVEGAGLDPAARLRIYRNSVVSTQITALRQTYPTVHALVGDGFFDALATRYRDRYPSASGNLQHFGGALAQCICGMPEADALGYLPDVALLDWARQAAALAPEALPVGPAACAAAATAAPEILRIVLHPSLQLLRSAYPVLTLWRWCQAPDTSSLQLDDNGESVLIWRDGDTVAMATVNPATFLCIEALAAGNDLACACASAVRADADFDLETCLRDLLVQGLITAWVDDEIAT